MVKETTTTATRESAIKKRRKNAANSEVDGEGDLYKKVIAFEEKEAFKRTAEGDAKLYFEICKNIRTLLGEISELKTQKSTDSAMKVSEKAMQAAACVVTLKKLNRLDKVRITTAREALNVEKQKVDSTNLQYQNLLYEAAHLSSEFKKCKQFKSKDEDIELVSIEEFLKEAPDTKTKPFRKHEDLDDVQKHELHLARLEWELTQRKKLAQLCNTFEDEKKQIAADILKTKNRLGGLVPKLAAVLEATKPLQDYLGLPIEKTYIEHKQASLLPNPLYLFYSNADAFKKVYDIDVTLNILGDHDEAIRWKRMQSSPIIHSDDTDQENDFQEVEEPVETKKRRHRKASQIDRNEERRKRLLEVHPFSVQVIIKVSDGTTLTLEFFYLVVLNIVTVKAEVEYPNSITGNAAKEVLCGENVLEELFNGDFGIDSPNPSNSYQLKKINLSSFHSLTVTLGYAYSWAQKVCGLDFLMTKDIKSATTMSCTNVEIVMKALNRRLKSRTALAVQLQKLEQNLIPEIPETVELPRNVVSSLTKWVSLTWQVFCGVPCTANLIANEMVASSDLFYCATISRPKSATLQAYVAIKNDYPRQTPIFCINVSYNGEFHSGNCDEIRDMERSVNIGWTGNTTSATWLLAAQLSHLCAYFDVFLEITAPSSFPQNTVFFKSICGRNRRRPFKFRKVGAGIFTQF
ncbi:hypothetical protein FQR65_LT05925 [Abscondita terminalis]|nr:hypothetical protein FQR65_LT05925 [Abscondita terminalis]